MADKPIPLKTITPSYRINNVPVTAPAAGAATFVYVSLASARMGQLYFAAVVHDQAPRAAQCNPVAASVFDGYVAVAVAGNTNATYTANSGDMDFILVEI